jgi:phospholipid/cholesterol/gamma-HCH transport system substrate-binding protein
MSKETKIGILAIVTAVVGYFGFQYLKGFDLFSNTYDYYVFYEDVGGLKTSNQVTLNGVSVGRVDKVIALPQENRVMVKLNIKKDIPLTANCEAILADESFLGGKIIRLQLVVGGKNLKDDDTLKSIKEESLAELVKEKTLPLVKNAETLVFTMNKVLEKFKDTGTLVDKLIKTTDASLAKTTTTLNGTIEENRSNLKALTANLQVLSSNLIETEKSLKPILANAQTITDSLSALHLGNTLNQANLAISNLQKMISALEAGSGTAGKILKDEAMYNNINRTLVDLDKLLYDFRQSPKRYVHFSVFGKKNTTPSPYVADTIK